MVHPDPVGVPNAVRDPTRGTVLAEAHARERGEGRGWVGDGSAVRARWCEGTTRGSAHARVGAGSARGGRRGDTQSGAHPPDVHGVHDELERGQVHRRSIRLPGGEVEVLHRRERVSTLLAPAHGVAAEHRRLDARQEIEDKRVDRELAAFERHALEHDAVPARDHVEPLDFEPRLALALVLARRLERAAAAHRSHRGVGRGVGRRRPTRFVARPRALTHHRVDCLGGMEEVVLAGLAGRERERSLVVLAGQRLRVRLLVAVDDEAAVAARAGKERARRTRESRRD